MKPILRIEVIGRAVAHVGERRIDPGAEVVFAALLYLALERGRRIPRTEFVELFWPDTPRAVRSGRLRWLLTKLRALGLPLATGGTEIWLGPAEVVVDARTPPEVNADWQSGVLPHYRPGFSAAFASWVEEQRDALTANLMTAAEAHVQAKLQRGEHASALIAAEWLQRVDPMNGRAAVSAAECACRLNAPAQAIAFLERFLTAADGLEASATLKATLMLRRIRENLGFGIATQRQYFVGRREQLMRLDSLLGAATEGDGGALMLTGPAGIGKTRLLDEIKERASFLGFRTIRVRSQRGDSQRPLSGVVELTAALRELPGAAGCSPEHLSRLGSLTHQNSDDTEVESASAGVRQSRLVEALTDLIDAVSDERPLLIQVDDAQWCDASLTWLWNELVHRSASARVAFVFAVRTSRRAPPALDAPAVIVGALDADAAAELLDQLLHAQARTVTAEVRHLLLERGAGSPLFLRELVRQWSTAGVSESLPTSLVGLFESALGTLSKEALRTLQVASVLGSYATIERIETVVQLPRPAFLDALVELEAAGIFTADDAGVVTGHVLWAEAASALISPNLERVLHRHTAELLEAEIKSQPTTSLLWESARHWEKSGHPELARRAILIGAEHLSRNGFPEDAVTAYDRALSALHDPIERLPIMEKRIHALLTGANWREALEQIDAFRSLSREVLPSFDPHNELELASYRARYAIGDIASVLPEALACSLCDRATIAHRLAASKKCAQAAELTNPPVLIKLRENWAGYVPRNVDEEWDLYCIEWVYQYRLGDIPEAVRLSESMTARQQTLGDYQRTINSLQHVASSCFICGRVGDGFQYLHDSMDRARARGDLDNLGISFDQLIGYTFDYESLDLAERRLKQATQLAQRVAQRGAKLVADGVLPAYHAQLAIMQGQPDRALNLVGDLSSALDVAVARWRVRLLAIHLAGQVARGNLSEAHRIADAMEKCFTISDIWRDWPATVYASYLNNYRSPKEAQAFSLKFVSTLRRELHDPPALLRTLAAKAPVETPPPAALV